MNGEPGELSFLRQVWGELREDPTSLDRLDPGGYPYLPAELAAAECAHNAVAVAALEALILRAADGPGGEKAGGVQPRVALNADRLTSAFTSDRHFRVNGEPPSIWGELSGFWPTADGWVRTHANYPHHRLRLLEAAGLPVTAGAAEFRVRVNSMEALQFEDAVVNAGGVAVAVRTAANWMGSPAGRTAANGPVLGKRLLGGGPRISGGGSGAPLAGIRVLDLTRVIAGPVATRTLAQLGADVLRVDTPLYPEHDWQHLDTGQGKRSTVLDLERTADRQRFEDLLGSAHVVVTGYRPCALDRFGLSPEALCTRRPGIVVGRLSAWGFAGPWAERRGFDSIVQAASGIALLESKDGISPGALPAQVLDHSAGYLLAGGVLAALRSNREEGGSWLVETSLARIASALLALAKSPAEARATSFTPTVETVQTAAGTLSYALLAFQLRTAASGWPFPSHLWADDTPEWDASPTQPGDAARRPL